MVNMIPVAQNVGSTRIVKTVAISHPLGDPALPEKEQRDLRYNLVKKALDVLTDDISEQTVYL